MSDVLSFDDEHEAFAASRVSQYVFVPSDDTIFQQLDQHADTLEGDVAPPFVLVGNEGSGKSALLANWVAKRREHRHRDEFLFQHYVGCTSQSLQLLHTLFRLETALKDFFQLREMKVPETEVELRWSLSRFLEAASKKHSPARIVIIIDGISRLKAEGAPDGALHWLPTELPPCVRFIVSSVEQERNFRNTRKAGPQHRTFVELARRQCPIVHVKPLVSGISGQVVKAFQTLYPEFALSSAQQIKVGACQATQQPMFLRALLQALRLAKCLLSVNIDDVLDKFLLCTSAHDLIDKSLNICCSAINTEEGQGGEALSDMLGKMMSVVYSSRSGLTEAEIWGLMRMVSKIEPTEEQAAQLMSILKDFTMVVNNMHTFSHEIYREVVYHKYITSRQALIRWHNVLARFFGQLPPCDRKLSALPYHLEMAGSWSKVKNCLTEIEMFQLWWTPKFKTDFIKFWASLTQVSPPGEGEEGGSGGGGGGGGGAGSGATGTVGATKKGMKGKTLRHGHGGGGGGSGGFGQTGSSAGGGTSGEPDLHVGSNRPTYDIVEEYVKSLDEFRTLRHPSDEVVAGIILEIADFLLEFAILGHENNADVPSNIHPKLLPEDMRSLGVPHVDIDEDDRFILRYPSILQNYSNKQKAEEGNNMTDATAKAEGPDGPGKAIDELPICTTYFFSRWLWIQFPYVAIGNVKTRFIEGVQHIMTLKQSDPDGLLQKDREPDQAIVEVVTAISENEKRSKQEQRAAAAASTGGIAAAGTTGGGGGAGGAGGAGAGAGPSSAPGTSRSERERDQDGSGDGKEMSKTWGGNASKNKLPAIKFHRKAARSIPRVNKKLDDPAAEASDKVAQRLIALQDSIQTYREEFDFLVQKKALVDRRLQEQKDALVDLQRTASSVHEFDAALEAAIKRKAEGEAKMEKELLVHRNLKDVYTMCLRHPAKVPALIQELQNKLEEDAYIIHEIKKRLWEQKFERQMAVINSRHLKNLLKESRGMQDMILEHRYQLQKALNLQQQEDERALLNSTGNQRTTSRTKSSKGSRGALSKDGDATDEGPGKEGDSVSEGQSWEEKWSIISSRTGIMEPEAFFERMNNSTALVDQINMIKKASEVRLEQMKKEAVAVEVELEEVRYEASFAGGVQSSKENKKQLAEKQQRLRQIKEKTEAMEQLEQRVVAGLAHISDILFIPKSEDDAQVSDLHKNIEAVLDTLINEREKQLQQQGQGQSGVDSKMAGPRDSVSIIPETYTNRSPELDFVIAKHESPQVRLPNRLPSRPSGDEVRTDRSDYDEEGEEDGINDRSYFKTQSTKRLIKAARAAEQSKSPNLSATT